LEFNNIQSIVINTIDFAAPVQSIAQM